MPLSYAFFYTSNINCSQERKRKGYFCWIEVKGHWHDLLFVSLFIAWLYAVPRYIWLWRLKYSLLFLSSHLWYCISNRKLTSACCTWGRLVTHFVNAGWVYLAQWFNFEVLEVELCLWLEMVCSVLHSCLWEFVSLPKGRDSPEGSKSTGNIC